jgi:hypothetical protein
VVVWRLVAVAVQCVPVVIAAEHRFKRNQGDRRKWCLCCKPGRRRKKVHAQRLFAPFINPENLLGDKLKQ